MQRDLDDNINVDVIEDSDNDNVQPTQKKQKLSWRLSLYELNETNKRGLKQRCTKDSRIKKRKMHPTTDTIQENIIYTTYFDLIMKIFNENGIMMSHTIQFDISFRSTDSNDEIAGYFTNALENFDRLYKNYWAKYMTDLKNRCDNAISYLDNIDFGSDDGYFMPISEYDLYVVKQMVPEIESVDFTCGDDINIDILNGHDVIGFLEDTIDYSEDSEMEWVYPQMPECEGLCTFTHSNADSCVDSDVDLYNFAIDPDAIQFVRSATQENPGKLVINLNIGRSKIFHSKTFGYEIHVNIQHHQFYRSILTTGFNNFWNTNARFDINIHSVPQLLNTPRRFYRDVKKNGKIRALNTTRTQELMELLYKRIGLDKHLRIKLYQLS